MDMSNAEKQARFRKKEALKRHAEKIFREAILSIHSKNPDEIRQAIDEAIELPTGWTDKDYEHAWRNLHRIQLGRYDDPHQLSNDVLEGRYGKGLSAEFVATSVNEYKTVLRNTQALAAHITSACNLSGCNDSDKAAALAEAMRLVGLSLLNYREVPKSNATTMCLATLSKQYIRPDWFFEKLAEVLAENIDKELTNNIKRMAKI